MRRIGIIVMTLTIVLGLSQCKKEQPTIANEGETVAITLDIQNNGGTRMDVNTVTGEVTYETGDVIYVASGGTFIGTLTHNGTNFGGTITNPAVGEPLHFYFLGNVTPTETLTAGTTTTCSVVISDQTEHLPVIEYAPSNEIYTAGATTFTAHLLNKCALVKFNVTTSSEAATCITGMKNTVTVNFAEYTLTHSQEGNGVITLPTGNGEKWAILLPQDAIEEGSAYSEDGDYTGSYGAVPDIYENGYLTLGIEVSVSTSVTPDEHEYVDLGLPSGLLWATCNVGADSPEDYGDYFAWGEIQPKDVYNWNTYQYCMGNSTNMTKYCDNGNYGYNGFTDNLTVLETDDDAATANWGAGWRMPTREEFQELLDNTTVTSTMQSGVNGSLFTATNGNTLFLPAAGYYWDDELRNAGSNGHYWSSSLVAGSPYWARHCRLESSYFYVGHYSRGYGQSVRAVRDAE